MNNNDHVSSYFKLSKGIRQGCPISALLFLVIVEVVAIIFRQLNNIKGLNLNGTNIKLCQLADDMTLFLKETKSVNCAIKAFEEFYRYAGLNKSKTVVFIPKGINPDVFQDNAIGIHGVQQNSKLLTLKKLIN